MVIQYIDIASYVKRFSSDYQVLTVNGPSGPLTDNLNWTRSNLGIPDEKNGLFQFLLKWVSMAMGQRFIIHGSKAIL